MKKRKSYIIKSLAIKKDNNKYENIVYSSTFFEKYPQNIYFLRTAICSCGIVKVIKSIEFPRLKNSDDYNRLRQKSINYKFALKYKCKCGNKKFNNFHDAINGSYVIDDRFTSHNNTIIKKENCIEIKHQVKRLDISKHSSLFVYWMRTNLHYIFKNGAIRLIQKDYPTKSNKFIPQYGKITTLIQDKQYEIFKTQIPNAKEETLSIFKSLGLLNSNFHFFNHINENTSPDDIFKLIFKNHHHKSIKKQFFKNLKEFNYKTNQYLIYKTIDKVFKDPNNILKIISNKTILIEFINLTNLEDYSEPTKHTNLELYFKIAFMLYSENQIANIKSFKNYFNVDAVGMLNYSNCIYGREDDSKEKI